MTKEEQDRVSGILVGIVIGIAVSNALLRLVLVMKIYIIIYICFQIFPVYRYIPDKIKKKNCQNPCLKKYSVSELPNEIHGRKDIQLD